jgi:hypothetical protein
MPHRPLVGLLNNPIVPTIIKYAPSLVEHIDVIPDRLWYDFEQASEIHGRFHRVVGAIDELKHYAKGRVIGGHGIGLSLPSAIRIDMAMVAEVASLAKELHFQWFSEHLSLFLVSHGSVPNSQAGLGLPVTYDDETFEIVKSKLRILKDALDCDLLLENGAVFTPVPKTDLSEPQLLNRLYSEVGCGTLLDLHNLYVQFASLTPFCSCAIVIASAIPDHRARAVLGCGTAWRTVVSTFLPPRMLRPTQFRTTSAICRFFTSSIIMWVTPRIPMSSSFR